MMGAELVLRISDPLLKGAVRSMLVRNDFTIGEDGEDVPVITDSEGVLDGYGCVLYVLRKECGGKKYILLRPFAEADLLYAVKTLLGETGDDREKRVDMRLDAKSRRVSYDGKRVLLTEKEFMLLALLLKNKGKAVSDAEITEKIWKNDVADGSNVVAVYVNYLRTKLENAFNAKMIYRVRGEGYMLKEIERKS